MSDASTDHDFSTNPMRQPGATFSQVLARVIPKSLILAFIVVLAGYIALATYHAVRGESFGDLLTLRALGYALRTGFFLFLLIFIWGVLTRYRPLQDRSFTLLGLFATFFGLGMLLLFFIQLGAEVVTFFRVTPQLIEIRNRELKERPDKIRAEALAEIESQMKDELDLEDDPAKKEEIRKDFDKARVIRLRTVEKTIEEAKNELAKGLREQTDSLSLFTHFLTNYPSDQSQNVGIYPALLGSLYIALLTIAFSVPVGVGAALYLEEYRTNNWLGRLIQVNINNLAGVPSVVYGILGAYIFVEKIFKPIELLHPGISARNLLGGGMTLGLLTLPVVIVSSQEAIRAVPISLRQAAYALGATRWQVTWHQVLPMSLPGILTGTILALSRAIGEAAPLVLFGASLFVSQSPTLFSRFTVLPMQIFSWADRPADSRLDPPVEIFQANAALASVILLLVLLTLNAIAIVLRNRSQKKLTP